MSSVPFIVNKVISKPGNEETGMFSKAFFPPSFAAQKPMYTDTDSYALAKPNITDRKQKRN